MDPLLDALAEVCSGWRGLLPPNRVPVSVGAAQTLVIARPGGAKGPWSPTETPYMVEPMDILGSREFTGCVFVAPAQSGKTAALCDSWMAHNVCNDPGDMLLVQMTQEKAREFSKQRIDRAIRNSPRLRELLSARARDDNTHDKQFKNGMWVRLAWPTVTNLSSTSYRYTMGTDYDRWPDDIDGEGEGWGLLRARTRTFGSRGMTVIESSPGRDLKDPHWEPKVPHEAPPVGGILGVYAEGDRRLRYWPCRHCGEFFAAAPGMSLFRLPPDEELCESIRSLDIDRFARQHAKITCPHCAADLLFSERAEMERGAVWLRAGLTIDARRRISGTPVVSTVASFWLGGVAAAYSTWYDLVSRHLNGLAHYEATGDEEKLKTTVNVDQGAPYLSMRLREGVARVSGEPQADTALQRYIVPSWARCVLASVDVQGGSNARFEVTAVAVGPYKETALIDRYAIKWSKRPGIGDEFAPIDPASHPEDWDVLTEQVVKATYRTEEDGVEVRVFRTAVDTGGEDGVTDKAYAWFRRLRAQGLSKQVRLTKGDGRRVDWHIRETMVGGRQGKGDVPLLLLETNKLKDMVAAARSRPFPGPGYVHLPPPKDPKRNPNGWMPQAVLDELDAEVRNPDGTWTKVRKRNETLDCFVMIQALCIDLGMDRKGFWDSPPAWAQEIGSNTMRITREERREEKAASSMTARRSAASPYLG